MKGALAPVTAGFVYPTSPSGVLPVFISSAIAQTAPAAAASGGTASLLQGVLPMLVILAAFYFLAIRPQMKRQKEHRAMIDALAKGDEIATMGGVVGKVTQISEGFVHLEIANGVQVQLQRHAVAQVLPKGTLK